MSEPRPGVIDARDPRPGCPPCITTMGASTADDIIAWIDEVHEFALEEWQKAFLRGRA